MDYPRDWKSPHSKSDVGHREMGRTIVLHSVAIAPEFQDRGLGGVLMKAYVSSMAGSGIADRLVLIAHDVRFSNSGAEGGCMGNLLTEIAQGWVVREARICE